MIRDLTESHRAFLRDESHFTGQAEDISFPRSEEEIQTLVRQLKSRRTGVTVQGGRTGLTGAGVPLRGHLMSCLEMNRPLGLAREPDGRFLLSVQPGYTLAELRRDLERRRFDWLDEAAVDQEALAAFTRDEPWCWPPDPSETTASLGGLAATGARGSNGWKYGSAGRHLASLRMVTAGGEVRAATGQGLAELIGGQGMFGAVTALTLRLARQPAVWGIAFFFAGEQEAAGFLDRVASAGLTALAALDFLDEGALTLVGGFKKIAAKLQNLPDPPAGARAMLYIELHERDDTLAEEAAGRLMALAEEGGVDLETSWALTGGEVEKLRLFRHAAPEAANARIGQIGLTRPGAVKLASDLTWPGPPFARALAYCREDLRRSGLSAIVLAHAADNHLHVNFLPETESEARRAEDILRTWLGRARDLKGELFREHGVGKLKRSFWELEAPERAAAWVERKKRLDPTGFWNPGNVFPLEEQKS